MPYLRRDLIQTAQSLTGPASLKPVEAPTSAPQPLAPAERPVALAPSGSASVRVELFAPVPDSTSAQAAEALEPLLQQALSLNHSAIPAKLQAQLRQTRSQLQQTLDSGNIRQPQQRQEAFRLLRQLGLQMQMAQLQNPPLRAGWERLSQSLLAEAGQDLQLQVQYLSGLPQLQALTPQTPAQQELLQESQALLRDLERNKAPVQKLPPETLLLLSLRDELLRRSLESIAPPSRETPLQANHLDSELGLIRGLVATADQLLASSRNLPPGLLADFSRLGETIARARPGEMAAQLKQLREQSTAPPLPSAAVTLPPAGQALSQAGQQLAVPAPLEQLLDLAQQGLAAGPPRPGQGLANLIAVYSQGMNAIAGRLPSLRFPVTLPLPLAYRQGDSAFILPAGSRLSQNPDSGAYQLQSPGLLMQNGETRVSARQASIQLGSTLDRLQIASLLVSEPGQDTLLSGVTAQINRREQSSLIQAEQIAIQQESGRIELENARLVQSPQSFELATDQLLYQQGENQLSTGQLGLWQYQQNGQENFQGGVQNLSLNHDQTVISADRMRFSMVREPGRQSGLLRFAGENIAIQSGDSLQLQRNAAGQLSQFSAQAEAINYAEGYRQGQLQDGALQLQYHPSGSLRQLGVSSGQLRWQDSSQGLALQGAGLRLQYGEAGQLEQVSGQVAQLTYQTAEQQLSLRDSQLQAEYRENGSLARLSAQAGETAWRRPDLHGQVEQTALQLETDAAGQVQARSAAAGPLQLNGRWGSLQTQGQTSLKLHYSLSGQLAEVFAQSERLQLEQDGYQGALASSNSAREPVSSNTEAQADSARLRQVPST